MNPFSKAFFKAILNSIINGTEFWLGFITSLSSFIILPPMRYFSVTLKLGHLRS